MLDVRQRQPSAGQPPSSTVLTSGAKREKEPPRGATQKKDLPSFWIMSCACMLQLKLTYTHARRLQRKSDEAKTVDTSEAHNKVDAVEHWKKVCACCWMFCLQTIWIRGLGL